MGLLRVEPESGQGLGWVLLVCICPDEGHERC